MNEGLLRDTAEARALAFGYAGEPSRLAVTAHLDFIHRPTARNWYRAHNASIVAGYLDNESLAAEEGRVERFFINVVLVRVLFAHALVASPRLALGWLAPAGRPVGDPRVGMTGIFMSLSRVLPDLYPLGDDVEPMWRSSMASATCWTSASSSRDSVACTTGRRRCLRCRDFGALVDGSTPTYAWDSTDDADVWDFKPSRLARLARRIVPAH